MKAMIVVTIAVFATCLAGPASAQKQIDIGAAEAPLSDAQRVALDNAVRRHDYKAEKTVIDLAVAEHAQSFELLAMAGRLAYLEKQPVDAAAALSRADKIRPLTDVDRLTLALALSFQDKVPEARVEFLKLMKGAPKNAEYPFLLGRMEANAGHAEEAAIDLRKAVQLDPDMVPAYEELGHAQETSGFSDEAKKTYETAVLRNRGNKAHWEWSPLDLGIVLLKADDLNGAEALIRESLGYNPRLGWAHYYLGQLYQKRGKEAEAMIEYKEAVVDEPTLRQAWLALARQFTRQENKPEAERSLAIFKQLEDKNNAMHGKKN